ncbi:MAG: PEGA domain-containing protein [Candidatus Omnitrophica bacterium]|nr:PEGA domain-containing protein [Candidatus Omnitrophota bacterium]MDD5436528.1 PEGA domain-containing protein [Candidatus Omnitrophota bacterium]
MRKVIVVLSIVFLGVSASGCATLITGWYQKVPVSSDPQGAAVQVDGGEKYTTPTKLHLKRNRDYTLLFTKEGYRDETVKLMHVVSGAIAGNAVLFGLAGLAVDNLTGSQFKLIPVKVEVRMKKASE